ncbi:MAG: ABC transporter ATP-binding protein [Lentisphaeria bacterium]|nr:ABC transporter ATP-binding protein [Lentisphaeria bacterium]
MEIKVAGLTKKFGSVTAVDNVSFSFSSGNIFGFIGPNGAGKTTTIRIMATLDIPCAGDVFYDGVSAVLYPEEARRYIGYMPDALPAYKDIMVWEYLDFCARSFGLAGALRKKRLAEVEEFTSLGGMRCKVLAALSKGMKQRVSLARALVHDPQVLIMDEPAAGLDPRARLELRHMLKELGAQKKAILLSSHILSELQDICDGAVIIEQGKLLSAGTLDDMNKQGNPVFEDQQTVAVTIACAARWEELKAKLRSYPAVKEIKESADGKFHIALEDWNSNLTPLMASLFNDGFPITEFSKEEVKLEELFLRISSGKVQ